MYNTIKDLEAAGIVKKSEAPVQSVTIAPNKPAIGFTWDRVLVLGFVAANAFCAFIYLGLPIVLAK